MTRNVETIGPEATLVEAARFMRNEHIGFLPVVEHDCVVGVITDRDITIRATAEGLDPRTTVVRSVMTRDVVTIAESESLYEADRLMETVTVRRLVVIDARGALSGVLSLDDLAALSEEDKDALAEPHGARRGTSAVPTTE